MWVEQIPHCAPTVHPYTMEQMVRIESGGRPLAVHVNGLATEKQPAPAATDEAVFVAKHWSGLRYRVDLGLTQLTDRSLPTLHLTIEQVLGDSPAVICANLAAGGAVLTAAYGAATARFGEGQVALAVALSAYNTGTFGGGFSNGYVARYFAPAVPAAATVPSMVTRAPAETPHATPVSVSRYAADTDGW